MSEENLPIDVSPSAVTPQRASSMGESALFTVLRSPRVVVALLALATFLLGLYRLDYESLTIDEADVAVFAQEPLSALLGKLTQPGENGPLYLLLLHGWILVAGPSEFSLRLFSLAFTVATVPLLYLLGNRLLGHPGGLYASLLLLCSSYVHQYSQMAKMYTMMLFLAVLSSYLLLRALEQPTIQRWLGYTAAASIAMYTHVFGALLIPWHGLFALVFMAKTRRIQRGWMLSLALLTLPYLPLALQRLNALRAPETLTRQFTGPQDLPGMLVTLAREYGTRWDNVPSIYLEASFVLLTFGGLTALLLNRDRWPEGTRPLWFLLMGITVPAFITFVFVQLGAPLFSSRYLIITLPCFLLVWSAALVGLGRRSWVLPVALLVLFAGVNGARWSQTAIAGQRFHEDWRGAVALLQSKSTPEEPVLVLHDPSWRAVRYYAPGPITLASLEGGPNQPPDLSKTPALPESGRVWLLAAYFDVDDLPTVEAWLESKGRLVEKTWLTGVMVSEYEIGGGR